MTSLVWLGQKLMMICMIRSMNRLAVLRKLLSSSHILKIQRIITVTIFSEQGYGDIILLSTHIQRKSVKEISSSVLINVT